MELRKVSFSKSGNSKSPMIRLQGKILKDANVEIGDSVEAEVVDKQIVLTIIKGEKKIDPNQTTIFDRGVEATNGLGQAVQNG